MFRYQMGSLPLHAWLDDLGYDFVSEVIEVLLVEPADLVSVQHIKHGNVVEVDQVLLAVVSNKRLLQIDHKVRQDHIVTTHLVLARE